MGERGLNSLIYLELVGKRMEIYLINSRNKLGSLGIIHRTELHDKCPTLTHLNFNQLYLE